MNRSAKPFAVAIGGFGIAPSPIDGQSGARRRPSGRERLPLLVAACGVVGLVAAQSSAQQAPAGPDPWPRRLELRDVDLVR